eukprot:2478400-Rhodomonas_salina.2
MLSQGPLAFLVAGNCTTLACYTSAPRSVPLSAYAKAGTDLSWTLLFAYVLGWVLDLAEGLISYRYVLATRSRY